MKTKKLGFDDATAGRSPDTILAYDPYYIEGYREGLLSKIEWAKQDLECFENEYYMDLAE
jgi:hypothetical protein